MKQDPTAPDSQDPELVNTLIPFEDIGKLYPTDTSTRAEFTKTLGDYIRFLNSTKDEYKTYFNATEEDITKFEDYVRNIFQAKSSIQSLDIKFRINVIEKIKNSRSF